MRYQVKEYWIVNPRLKSVQIYCLDEEGIYDQVGIYKNNDILSSMTFSDLSMSLRNIFSF
jgi:Uma2 family endonuclease